MRWFSISLLHLALEKNLLLPAKYVHAYLSLFGSQLLPAAVYWLTEKGKFFVALSAFDQSGRTE